jgi:regulatory protein
MKSEEYDQILQRMMSVCSKNEKCAYDIEQKLKKNNLPDDEIEKILDDLQESDFINHIRYTEAFVNDKLRFNHWGKRKIAHALRAKNIDEKIINQKLEEIDTQLYEKILNEELEKKISSVGGISDKRDKEKVVRYLLQKGFEYGKIFDIIDKRTNIG